MKKYLESVNLINISEAIDEHPELSENPNNRNLFSSKILRNIKGIIFDFDGTLFDNAKIPLYMILACPHDIMRLWKERKVRKQFASCDYLYPEKYFRVFFTAMGKACYRPAEKIRHWYFNRFMPRMIRVVKRHYMPRPGAQELFHLFDETTPGQQNRPKVAVYSDYPFLKERLQALGLEAGQNVRLYGPDCFGAQKPAARPFLSIAYDMGISPQEVLVVGDREETDGLGAFRAGMRFFCLETGHRRHYNMDPYRKLHRDDLQGPSLIMYAGRWDDLYKLLIEKYGKNT